MSTEASNVKTSPSSSNSDTCGLACRRCGCRHFYVIYTRRAPGGKVVRRRECRNCNKRMTTIEQER